MTQCAISARALVMLHVAVSTMLAHDVRGKLEQKQFTKVSVMHAELLLVVARSALSARENVKIWRALEWTMVFVSNAKTNVENLANVMGEERAQNITVSSRRKELALTVQCQREFVMHVQCGACG